MQAIWNGIIIAESDKTEKVVKNHVAFYGSVKIVKSAGESGGGLFQRIRSLFGVWGQHLAQRIE